MNPITAHLGPDSSGAEVVNLQDGLRRLITSRRLELDDRERERLLITLAEESQRRIYGETTLQAVVRFQEQRQIEPSGKVDEATADRLNVELEEIGGFTSEDGGWEAVLAALNQQAEVLRAIGQDTGRLATIEQDTGHLGQIDANIAHLGGMGAVFTIGARGDLVRTMQQQLVQAGYHVPDRERNEGVLGAGTSAALRQLQERSNLARTGAFDDAIRNALAVAAGAAAHPNRIEGRIFLDTGQPAQKVTLRIINRAFGGRAADTWDVETDDQGFYALPYTPQDAVATLEVQLLTPGQAPIPLARPKANLARHTVSNLIAPKAAQRLPAEYNRLTADLTPYVGAMTALANAKEGKERPDLSILSRTTGWDARLIALASLTEKLAADPEVGLTQEALYGLLRAGLPSDKQLLAQVDTAVVAQALQAVTKAGIVALTAQEQDAARLAFATFSTKTRLNVPTPGSRSTYGELMAASGLPQEALNRFATVYLNHQGDAATLWDKARDAGLNQDQIDTLQLHGKLAFLAGSSAPLTNQLMRKQLDNQRISDPAQLIALDFHYAETWRTEIFDLAGVPNDRRRNLNAADRKNIESIIPVVYTGATLEARLATFAEDMARRLRLSYPTQVLTRRIESEAAFTLPVGQDATLAVLKQATNVGFRLGKTPAAVFLRDHPEVLANIPPEQVQPAQQQFLMLQRLYQITPTDEAMLVLRHMAITSAHDVTAYTESAFTEQFDAGYVKLFGRQPIEMLGTIIHQKSVQVSSVTYNLFTIAKTLEGSPLVQALSSPPEVYEDVKNELIKHFPTMESLFGSLDFCECEHCRSVLSPAAYLVDLLQFVDTEPGVWGNFLATWSKRHSGQPYPHTDARGVPMKPYDVLIERRPDLPHILLTCENTHTALPYIDIVNEILEYYVANGRLTDQAANDTGSATTAELLAEPQHVIREAYDTLRSARYPRNLPFDPWIETVRQFCTFFETPLDHMLEVFRPSDDLFAPQQPFDRAAIFLESLGLSPSEVALFTDPAPLAQNRWHELYGFPADIPFQNPTNVGNATLTVANSDARKLGVGMDVGYFAVASNTPSADSRRITAIASPDSGALGQTRITLDGRWAVAPQAGDRLVCLEPQALRSAKALSRRLEVTYKELVEIIQTSFVNPSLTSLALLYKLDVQIQDARRYQTHQAFYNQNRGLIGANRALLSAADQLRYDALANPVPGTGLSGWELLNELAAFDQRLNDLAAAFQRPVGTLQTAITTIPFRNILVLADPEAGCNFDQTTLQYADGTPADPIVFLRITLFVRLWRRLGWTIEETDRALSTCIPATAPLVVGSLPQRPLQSALVSLAHLKTLDAQLNLGKQSRLKLLTLWANLPTTGKKPLYDQLFLIRSVFKSGEIELVVGGRIEHRSVFDDPLGEYLKPTDLTAIADQVRYEVQQADVSAPNAINSAPFAGEARISVSYDPLGEVQHLTYLGILTPGEEARMATLAPSGVLTQLLADVRRKATEFTLIKGHQLAIQGALGLTATEIDAIFQDDGQSLATAALSLANLSLLYRYGLLARALKLSVAELIALRRLSGLNPFTPLHPNLLTTLAEDHPFSQTIRFIEVASQVKESGLKIADLEYLLRHRFDETGPYRPNREANLALLKTLAAGIRAIRAEHAVPAAPGGLSEEALRQKLSLVLAPETVEHLMTMLNGTAEFTAASTAAVADQLAPATFAGEPAIHELRYNAVRQEQKLTWRGVLFDPQKTALQTRFDPALSPAQRTLFAKLLSDIQQQARAFFDNQLKRQRLRLNGQAGFLDEGDFDTLFLPLTPLLPLLPTDTPQRIADKLEQNATIETANQTTLHGRRHRIVQALLPVLQRRLIRQLVAQTITATTGADQTLVESLLTDERLLQDANARPLLEALAATGVRGVDAKFYSAVDLTGVAQAVDPVAKSADTALKPARDRAGNPLAAAGSARFEGYLEVPAPGAYRFLIELDAVGAQAELRFAHLLDPVFLSGSAITAHTTLGTQPGDFLEIKPGVLYPFSLKLTHLGGGGARLLVQGETLPRGGLHQLALVPQTVLEQAEQALLLLSKVLMLVQHLGLSERELRYLLTHSADFGDLNLSELATDVANDIPAGAIERFGQFLRLAAYTRLRADLASGTDDLITLFEANAVESIDAIYARIARLTRRDEDTVKTTSRALAVSPAFPSEQPLARLWEALQMVERFGVPVAELLEWTHIVSPAATPERCFGIARSLKEAIKARFEPEVWQRVAQPIFDNLRQLQRDALAVYVMHQSGFARIEQLYEYFLIDPGMEPVVQTSRIRLAIASLQLFIQRCLLNLESKVHPSTINADHWAWMKRYRVWEANRKIFLYPENWLEPEFRDDKTHLFTELEGALLEGDVSSDLVEDAFFTYLKKFDELARLDLVAMHIEDDPDPAHRALHVFGRTFSAPYKYFYRRYTHQMWTPWEPVSAEIEGDHLAPVIWRDRLYLFWVTFMEKAQDTNSQKTYDPTKTITIPAVGKEFEAQLHWSEYLNGEWSTRESSSFTPPSTQELKVSASDLRGVFVHVSKEPPEDGEERGVFIHLSAPFNKSFYLAGRNSMPERRDTGGSLAHKYTPALTSTNPYATRYLGSGPLKVTFAQRIVTTDAGETTQEVEPLDILQSGSDFILLPCNNDLTALGVSEDAYRAATNQAAVKAAVERSLGEIAALIKPVFYQDNLNTFFVEPAVTERTVEEWEESITRLPSPERVFVDPLWWDKLVLIPEIPRREPLSDLIDLWREFEIDREALVDPVSERDWLANPKTVLLFDGALVGPTGQSGLEIFTGIMSDATLAVDIPVQVSPGSAVATGTTVVLRDLVAYEQSGMTQTVGGLNVIGGGGVNAALEKNLG